MRLTKKGFFTVDLVIAVVVLLVILLGITYKGSEGLNTGRASKALADAATICSLVSEYNIEVGHYPTSLDKLTQKEGDYVPWMLSVPKDPWGHAYIYQYNNDGYVVYSFGKDGRSHGSTINKISVGDLGYTGK